MPILVILIICSFSFYIFYRVKSFRCKRPTEKQWIAAKSRIALGAFVVLFGINQLFINATTVTYIVATIFIVVGGLSIWAGIKAYKYILPLAIQEAEAMRKN